MILDSRFKSRKPKISNMTCDQMTIKIIKLQTAKYFSMAQIKHELPQTRIADSFYRIV